MHPDLMRALGEMDRVPRVVRTGAGDDGVRVSHLVQRHLVERQALGIGERRRLARRARDDDPVGPVVDEVAAEGAEAVERDCSVGVERRHDGGEDFAEHRSIVPGRGCAMDCSQDPRARRQHAA